MYRGGYSFSLVPAYVVLETGMVILYQLEWRVRRVIFRKVRKGIIRAQITGNRATDAAHNAIVEGRVRGCAPQRLLTLAPVAKAYTCTPHSRIRKGHHLFVHVYQNDRDALHNSSQFRMYVPDVVLYGSTEGTQLGDSVCGGR